jgi:hypothetical protein
MIYLPSIISAISYAIFFPHSGPFYADKIFPGKELPVSAAPESSFSPAKKALRLPGCSASIIQLLFI